MNSLSEIRFWVFLLILPFVIIGAVYNIGYLVGYNIMSQGVGLPLNYGSMGLIAAGFCSIRPFIETVGELKIKISSKCSVN
ncbi:MULTISPECIES: hypothetical protein [unclassified Shewanella]|uniref:hypothetical protein n=1 Tax=unclassified Shewanella TaxID=196818 RepID=UPI000C84238C|nr:MULTISPECIES: hypothetical protein [unclassified Shewanella]MCC4834749.1 hypothetical protein [Shewanella sp. 10N.7]PMG80044.1 hypothetical protein BCU84_04705 [Shewanella sp. 10N.286.51.B7]